MGELSEQNRALIEREFSARTALRAAGTEGGAIFTSSNLNHLLDAARTEGRGEGRDELEDGNRQAEAELFEAILKWLGERDLYDRRDYFHEGITADDIIEQLDAHEAALASPIREPEISRTKRDEIARIIDPMPFDDSAAGWVGMPETRAFRQKEAFRRADAILNLAPVGGRGEEGSSRADLSPASRSPDQNSAGGEG